jgi:WD40 repeat protein/nucleoside phosphorylase
MGDDNRVSVEAIHREVYGVPDLNKTQSANSQLNRLLAIINDAAKEHGVSFKACITSTKKGGAGNRWVWFEEGSFLVTPSILGDALDLKVPRINPKATEVSGEASGSVSIQPIGLRGIPRRVRPIVVLMTFNEYETAAILEQFCPNPQPPRYTRNGFVYHDLGVHNGAEVILVMSGQGISEAQAAAEEACAIWRPHWLIGVGIAFGVDSKKQNLADVLVGTFSQEYESQRIEPDDTATPRGVPLSSSVTLRRLIKQLDNMKKPKGEQSGSKNDSGWPTLRFGGLLCGNKLIDSLDYRDSLLRLYPNIIGGEMEALGLAAVAEKPQYRAEWIIVKAISDWADGTKKSPNKKKNQKKAACAAAKVVYELLYFVPVFAPLDEFEFFEYDDSPIPPLPSKSDESDHDPPLTEKKDYEKTASHFVFGKGELTSLKKTDEPPVGFPRGENGIDVAETLLAWATQVDSKSLFVLLGEYGMGKTVSCQHFAKVLESKREQDHVLPIPLYFDLRNVTGLEQRVPTVEDIMLECARRDWTLTRGEEVSLEIIKRYLEQGAVAIFDGLDEVLVKLTGSDGATFTRNLLSLLDRVKKMQVKTGGLPLKILISSRTQYFRTLRDERNHLTGGERGNKDEDAFQAMLLLPFDDEQVRQYLSYSVSESETSRVMQLIREMDNLEELTHRPYTLSFVTEQLPVIERARTEGRMVNGATIFREMARSWLDRDSYKHHIEPRHKLSLAAHLAAHLWKTRSSSLPVDDLEEWFHDWLEAQPKIYRLYEKLDRTLLEEDMRNTTFLSRVDRTANDSSYRFAHTSLQEFFLAEFLVDAIRKNESQLWEGDSSQEKILCPSVETLDFMGQILAEVHDRKLMRTLEGWIRTVSTPVNTIILHYTLRAASRNYPYPQMQGMNLSGVELSNLYIPREGALNLSGADFSGANLQDARIVGCNLKGARFSDADFLRARVLECNLEGADLDAAKLSGAAFRRTNLAGTDKAMPALHQTAFISCEELPQRFKDSEDSLIAPLSEQDERWRKLQESTKLRSLQAHGGRVSSVAFTSDGATLASGSGDGAVRLWDVKSGKCIATLKAHSDRVNSVAFSSDDTVLASGSDDYTVKLWDVKSGKCTATLKEHKDRVASVAFARDEMLLASGDGNGIVKLWDVKGGECTATLPGHAITVNSVAFTSDGATLASGSDDHTVKFWDVKGGKCTKTFRGHRGAVRSVAFSSDDTVLASGSDDYTVKLWDVKGGECTVTLEEHKDRVASIAFSSDDTVLASGSDDRTAKLWDVKGGKCTKTFRGHRGEVGSVAFTSDDTVLASGSHDRVVRLWEVKSHKRIATFKGDGFEVTPVALTFDGTTLASGGGEGTIRLWDVASGRCTATLAGHGFDVNSIAFVSDGAILASGSNDRTVKLWDVESGKCTATLAGHGDTVKSVAFTSDGAILASGSGDCTVRLWDVESGKCIVTLAGHDDTVNSIAFSPDDTTLASGGSEGTVKLWDVASGRCTAIFEDYDTTVASVAFSPDGSTLASGSGDGVVRLWDVKSGKCTLSFFPNHKKWVNSVAFSLDGSTLASGSNDLTVKLWDIKSGTCIATFDDYSRWVNSVVFTSDGETLVSGDDEGAVRFWDIKDKTCWKNKKCWRIEIFPNHQYAVWNEDDNLRFASEDAWEYLGWQVPGEEGGMVRTLPAETFGPLPLPPA